MSNKNNCALLLCVLALLILITLNNINYADTTNSRPLVIANIESNKPIYFDVSADESGDIHLIWLTRDNILTYQKSTDEGKNWISIHTVKIPIIQERIQPSIFAIKSQVFIIWAFDGCLYRLASPDNGNTWDTIQTVIDKPARRITFPGGRSYVDNYDSISVANTPTLVISGQILDSTIYIAYESLNWLGTFISKSYDLGIHWTQPILLFPNDFCEERTPSLTMFVDLNGVHLFYRNLHPTDSINYGMNYMFSPDKGSTWRNRGRICTLTKDPEDVCVIDSTGELPILIAGKDTLQFMYRVEDLYRLISDNNGQTWSGPYSFGIGYIEEFTVYSR